MAEKVMRSLITRLDQQSRIPSATQPRSITPARPQLPLTSGALRVQQAGGVAVPLFSNPGPSPAHIGAPSATFKVPVSSNAEHDRAAAASAAALSRQVRNGGPGSSGSGGPLDPSLPVNGRALITSAHGVPDAAHNGSSENQELLMQMFAREQVAHAREQSEREKVTKCGVGYRPFPSTDCLPSTNTLLLCSPGRWSPRWPR